MPLERIAALRQAFDRMVADPKFLADAQARHLDVVPSTGQEMEALVLRTLPNAATIVSVTSAS